MAGNLKGLTIELGGDTTKLGKALEDVNKRSRALSSELNQVNKLLKLDPGNADLLAQKQEILAEAVANTSKKLETLKEAEKQVQDQFERGEASADQVRALQREIVATTQKLDQYENALDETAKAVDDLGRGADDAAGEVDDLGDASKDAGKAADEADGGFTILKGTLADLVSSAIQKTIGALKDMVGSLFELSEATREYRESMAQLDTAYTTNGHSTELATEAYRNFYRLLGETDTATEASNLLAQLATSAEDVDSWYRIAAGTLAKFPDSIPTEGLIEAANETAKVGQVTGVLADAINWATVSNEEWNAILGEGTPQQQAFSKAIEEGASAEDAFNAALEECADQQERTNFVTETMLGLYGEAGDTYNEVTEGIQKARDAEADLEATQAELGKAIEPITTAFTDLKNKALQALVPVVEDISQKFQELQNWMKEHPAVAGAVTAAVVALGAAFGILAGATAISALIGLIPKLAGVFQGLNLVMMANPITLVVAAIAGLVAAFVYLWQNCESFREFWINLWEAVKEKALTIAEDLAELPELIYNAISGAVERVQTWGADLVKTAKEKAATMRDNVVNTLKELPGKIYSAIVGAVDKVKTWGTNLVKTAKEKATTMRDNVVSTLKELPGKIYSAIVGAVDKVKTWGTNLVSTAKGKASDMLSGVVSTLAALPGKIYSAISGAINKVVTWGSSLASKGAAAAKKLVTAVTNGVRSLPGKMAAIGKNLVQGLWNGISNMTGWIIGKIKGFSDSVLNGIKSFFGINSPSRVFRDEVGKMLVEGMAIGITGNKDKALQAVEGLVSSMTSTATTESKSYTDVGKECVENIKTGVEKNKEKAVSAMQDIVDAQFSAFKDKNGDLKEEYAEVAEQIMDSYTEALDEGCDRAIELIDKRVSELCSIYQEKYNDIISARDDMEKKLINADELFTFDDDGRVILANLDKDIKQISTYEDALTELQERFGVSQTLLAEITQLGIEEGTKAAQKLLRMTDEEFQKFNAKWEEKQKLAKAVAEKFYSDQIAALDVAFNQKLNATLSSVPDTMKDIGVDSMQGWIDGMNSSLGDLEEAGAKIARRFIASIKDEMGIASPSKEMAWIGDMIDRGLEKGLLDGASNPIAAMSDVIGRVTDTAENFNGLSLERNISSIATPAASAVSIATGLTDKLDRILAAIERGQVLTIDGAALVGATADRYDATLGKRRALAARGAV